MSFTLDVNLDQLQDAAERLQRVGSVLDRQAQGLTGIQAHVSTSQWQGKTRNLVMDELLGLGRQVGAFEAKYAAAAAAIRMVEQQAREALAQVKALDGAAQDADLTFNAIATNHTLNALNNALDPTGQAKIDSDKKLENATQEHASAQRNLGNQYLGIVNDLETRFATLAKQLAECVVTPVSSDQAMRMARLPVSDQQFEAAQPGALDISKVQSALPLTEQLLAYRRADADEREKIWDSTWTLNFWLPSWSNVNWDSSAPLHDNLARILGSDEIGAIPIGLGSELIKRYDRKFISIVPPGVSITSLDPAPALPPPDLVDDDGIRYVLHDGGLFEQGVPGIDPTVAIEQSPFPEENLEKIVIGGGFSPEPKYPLPWAEDAGRVLGGTGAALTLFGSGYSQWQNDAKYHPDMTTGKHVERAAATAALEGAPAAGMAWGGAELGGIGGAEAGAVIGTMILPVGGTAVGAVVGGIVGGIVGGFWGSKSGVLIGRSLRKTLDF